MVQARTVVLSILFGLLGLSVLPAAVVAETDADNSAQRIPFRGTASGAPETARMALPAAQQGARAWVSGELHPSVVVIRVLNPGNKPTRVTIHTRKLDGSRRWVPHSMTLQPGETGVKDYIDGYSGSMVIRSERPVFAYGRIRDYDQDKKVARSMMSMHFFPIDCDKPRGVEWVCNLQP